MQHYIEDDYDPDPDRVFSGFDRGREELVIRMLDDPGQVNPWNVPHHLMVESQFWNNSDEQAQCNDNSSFSNGYVYHIGLCEISHPC